MSTDIRDLQFCFHAGGRAYVVEVRAPGRNPAPVSAGPFDVHIAVITADILPGSDVEPERIVRRVIRSVRPLVGGAVTPQCWGKFADAVLAWACAHLAATAERDHR